MGCGHHVIYGVWTPCHLWGVDTMSFMGCGHHVIYGVWTPCHLLQCLGSVDILRNNRGGEGGVPKRLMHDYGGEGG